MIDKEGDGQEAGAEEAVVTVEDTPAVDPKIEAEAKEMGWKPKEAWKGDPEGWRQAAEFVKRGKEILPIVAAENKRLRAELETVRRESDDKLARIEKMSQRALKSQREQLVNRYEALEERAAEQGDVKALRAAKAAKETAVKAFDAEIEEKKPTNGKDNALSPSDQKVMSEWLYDNRSWFDADEDLRAVADRMFDRITKAKPDLPLAERLQEVKDGMEEKFPTHFGKKPRNGAAMVEGANGRGPEGGSSGGGESWAKVPAEARKTAMAHITEERLYDHVVGAKSGQPLTQTQIKAAQEAWAREYLS